MVAVCDVQCPDILEVLYDSSNCRLIAYAPDCVFNPVVGDELRIGRCTGGRFRPCVEGSMAVEKQQYGPGLGFVRFDDTDAIRFLCRLREFVFFYDFAVIFIDRRKRHEAGLLGVCLVVADKCQVVAVLPR